MLRSVLVPSTHRTAGAVFAERIRLLQESDVDLAKVAVKYGYRLPDLATTLVSMARYDL